MTTVSTLVTEIRQFVRDTDTNSGEQFFTESELIGYINRSVNELCYLTDINVRTYEYIVNTSALSNIRQIPIITLTAGAETGIFEWKDLLVLDNGDQATGWRDLRVTTARNLRILEDETLKKCVQIYDNILHFNSDLSGNGTTGDTVAIDGRWLKTQVSSLADTYPLDISCEHATVAYACAYANYKKQQFDSGDRWMNTYKERLAEIKARSKKFIASNNPDGLSLAKRGIEYTSNPLSRTIPSA